ncbi:hypothetical protein COS83_04030 [archaeon CG07_land_8_20_14_0_80_38_8]|nr:MAG: hypothetical protein COS83_04030 [archaeon CG07_land_8_20_14_0_80_38_8]
MNKQAIIVALLISAIILTLHPLMEWDEYVYLLNAKYFAGQNIYFENIRPPIIPVILSFFYKFNIEQAIIAAPIILSIIYLITSYVLFSKFLKNRRISALLFILASPVFIFYFGKFMTSIPAGIFLNIAVIFMKNYTENQKNHELYLCFLSTSLAFLTRYPMGLTYPIILALYFIFAKNKNLKQLIISQLFFFAPMLVWINYAGLESFYYALLWANHEVNALYYLYNAPLIIGAGILLLPFLLKYKFRKEDAWQIIPLITIILFFQLFPNKNARFLIPILPFLGIILMKNVKIPEKYLNILLTIFFITSLICAVNYCNSLCNNSGNLEELRQYFSNQTGVTILSNFWPICSYYTNNTCYALLEPLETLNDRINYTNASYIIISTNYDYPEYSSSPESFAEYSLSMNKLINNSCEEIIIYGVNE